jgi:hypothetical protein
MDYLINFPGRENIVTTERYSKNLKKGDKHSKMPKKMMNQTPTPLN